MDPGSAGSYYKLSAMDAHGNESAFALLTPSGTVSAGDEPRPAELAFALASRNPVREEAIFRLALPEAGGVSLALYDASGRLVRELLHGPTGAGVHAVRWNGRDGAGRLAPAGFYFARLRTLGREIRARLAVVR